MPHCIPSQSFVTVRESTYIFYNVLVLIGLFVNPLSHIVHINCRLQLMYYNTTYNIWTSKLYIILNSNTKFINLLELVFVTTCIYIYTCVCVCVYLYRHIYMLRIQIKHNNIEWYWVMLHEVLFRCLLLKWLQWAKICIGIPSKIFLQWVKWIYRRKYFEQIWIGLRHETCFWCHLEFD